MTEQDKKIAFSFDRFLTKRFWINAPLLGSEHSGKLSFYIESEFSVDPAHKNIVVNLVLGVNDATESDTVSPIGEIDVMAVFKFQQELPLTPEGIVDIPQQLLATLFSLSISTARGVLIAKGAGTILERIILPVVNPMDFVRNLKTSDAATAQVIEKSDK